MLSYVRPLPVLLLALAVLGVTPAGAVPLTVSFTGTIYYIDPPLGAPFVLGQSGSGSFQIESTTPDDAPFVGVGIYRGPVNFSYTFGSYTATSAGGTSQDSVRIDNVTPPAIGADLYSVDAVNVSGATLLDAFFPTHLLLVLNDQSATAFSSDALPTSLALADFGHFHHAAIEFGTADGGGLARVILTLTSITVPEPAVLALLGLAALALRRRAR